MKLKVTSLIFVALITTIYAALALATEFTNELKLVGLAEQKQFNVAVFEAAIYAKRYTHYQDLFIPDNNLRMEIKLKIKHLSARQTHRTWIELILINSTRAELKRLSDPLQQFSRLVTIKLFRNDRMVFNYTPQTGTEILVNDVLIGRIEDPDFQKILTLSWFGKRPPSKTFGESIKRFPSQSEIKRYESIRFTPERVKQLKKQYPIETIAIAATPKIVKKTKPEIKVRARLIAKTEAEIKPTSNASLIVKQQLARVEKTVVKPEIEKNRILQAKNSSQPIAENNLPKQQKMNSDNPGTKLAKLETQPENKPFDFIDELINKLKIEYIEEVKSYIELEAKPVPPKSIRSKPKGDALVAVTIERNKGAITVVSSKLLNGNFNPKLNDAIHQSIKKLKRIPPMPESLESDQLTINVRVNFSSCKRTFVWICN